MEKLQKVLDWMKKPFLGVPIYAYFVSAVIMAEFGLIYMVTGAINARLPAYDLTIHGFDDKIPVVPAFTVIYILSFVFWFVGPIVAAKADKRYFFNYVMSAVIGIAVGGIFYLAIPTTNIRPEITGTDVFSKLLKFIYDMDGGARPTNLFPSYHCMLSIYCYLGVMNRKEVHIGYRIGCLIMAILVCISTQVLKQHYIVDFILGLALCLLTFFLCEKFNWGKPIYAFFEGREAADGKVKPATANGAPVEEKTAEVQEDTSSEGNRED